MIGRDLFGVLHRLAGGLLEPQTADGEGLAAVDLPLPDLRDFEATAAQVAGDAVGVKDAGDDAERSEAAPRDR
jgi:hypothetical protein